MDGDSTLLASSGEAAPPPAEAVEEEEAHDEAGGGGGGSNSGEEGDKNNYGGNRWPRPETLALLKIRSDMDAVFRDATHKAPLWDEVSRKLGELGFNRTPKKCKEKFENVYKYHKRTKEGRSGKSDNSKKVYRFSDELEAFGNHHHHNHISFQSHHHPAPAPPLPIPRPMTTTVTVTVPPYNPPAKIVTSTTVPSTMNNTTNNNSLPPKSSIPLSNLPKMAANVMFSSSTSSSTASEEDPFRSRRRKRRKRKWSDFFVRLTKEVIEKQEGLQLKFLEALERIENQRKLRDEAWRMKELTRVNQEHEVLVQEMSVAAAKDAAVVAFLQKISPSPFPFSSPLPPQSQLQSGQLQNHDEKEKVTTAVGNSPSSRWPKTEVEALIRLRTEMEMKYQDQNGPKGLLWEEISAAMRGLGYNRSSKRCKEKWENINKYFKKVKDSNKKRPEDSKTCPYFHQLDALYKEKEKNTTFDINSQMEPLMVEPEQQWPPPPLQPNQIMVNGEGIHEQEEEEEEEDDDDGGSSSTDVEN
ncbi:trihelix transcription factor GT-2-like [Momordica charantia]|uniref:Trihelix transcription factor GT-2-like n=1 Tax=Momordica charantia TaxID=3673 RepID=A0A6J1DLE6_MOMCH|nr:trihelix transcription factor GT-2-like [Momordica charantia]